MYFLTSYTHHRPELPPSPGQRGSERLLTELPRPSEGGQKPGSRALHCCCQRPSSVPLWPSVGSFFWTCMRRNLLATCQHPPQNHLHSDDRTTKIKWRFFLFIFLWYRKNYITKPTHPYVPNFFLHPRTSKHSANSLTLCRTSVE